AEFEQILNLERAKFECVSLQIYLCCARQKQQNIKIYGERGCAISCPHPLNRALKISLQSRKRGRAKAPPASLVRS
ncbi:hypothetical protein, partial [Campylobacter rectus]